jgi:hypothetical protein
MKTDTSELNTEDSKYIENDYTISNLFNTSSLDFFKGWNRFELLEDQPIVWRTWVIGS